MPDPTRPTDRASWTLVVEPLPDRAPAAARVRRWLKAGLRLYRLRCVVARDPRPDELAAADPFTLKSCES
jgi:hypothetical protein